MNRIVALIISAERSLVKGLHKKDFVISLFNSQLTDEQRAVYSPIIGEVIDLCVELMKTGLLQKHNKGCFCS